MFPIELKQMQALHPGYPSIAVAAPESQGAVHTIPPDEVECLGSYSSQTWCVGSPLTKIVFYHAAPECTSGEESFCVPSWCPCCKRPLEITSVASSVVYNSSSTVDAGPTGAVRYAYVTALWGDNEGYCLGAMVLGYALTRTGTQHDLVLLHDKDVTAQSLALLGTVWTLQLERPINAHDDLFLSGRTSFSRFSHVFFKLHVFGLLDYDKVLMLDIDLVILGCLDYLFDYEPPMALWRGMTQTEDQGFPIDCRGFFGGDRGWCETNGVNTNYAWCQMNGVNAGVMLLRPNIETYNLVMHEVETVHHPERIACPGPEQDYLSRFFAAHWKHLSVLHNYQLHHILFGLEEAVRRLVGFYSWGGDMSSNEAVSENVQSGMSDDEQSVWLPSRITMDVKSLLVVHFSGEFKIWDIANVLDGSDEDCTKRMLELAFPDGARLWISKIGSGDEYERFGIKRLKDKFESLRGPPVGDQIDKVVKQAVEHLQSATLRAVKQWRADLREYNRFQDLKPKDVVEVYWWSDESWYPAVLHRISDIRELHVNFTCNEYKDEPGVFPLAYVRRATNQVRVHPPIAPESCWGQLVACMSLALPASCSSRRS